jgi:hypothetical protein
MNVDPHTWAQMLGTLYTQAWHRLVRGVHDRHAPARHPTLATVTPDGWPQARTVVLRAADHAQHTLDAGTTKARFWQRWAGTPLNERQAKSLNRLLDDFQGKLTSSKWAAIAKCSPDTALRDINDLLARGVLRKTDAGGRSTHCELN